VPSLADVPSVFKGVVVTLGASVPGHELVRELEHNFLRRRLGVAEHSNSTWSCARAVWHATIESGHAASASARHGGEGRGPVEHTAPGRFLEPTTRTAGSVV
jgi:hypothetical protein